MSRVRKIVGRVEWSETRYYPVDFPPLYPPYDYKINKNVKLACRCEEAHADEAIHGIEADMDCRGAFGASQRQYLLD